ncbi:hypothetical protein NQ314_001874 [Rhamnusium bicolor]|uniref:Sulfatase N-terminal domain-containing protein n=1 Tax=Rhamnusium bicolor TaxID=1586634 RepID=A0AAV8ZQW2_9CUCU|nr:hypothetical protein NQ314_001874 [Rhamnusium bicolor]
MSASDWVEGLKECYLILAPRAIAITLAGEGNRARPHIIFIIADDLGWNDVGFHGSNQIPTPNIDAMAYSGLILNNYYVTAICTPSRSALMTGKYPIHTGMQHAVLYGAEARGLPLTEKILPQYLEELGYINHIVGKWHLGSYKRSYWTGHQDYFDHTAVENPGWGLDMRRNMNVAYDLHGQYSTDLFTKESVKLITNHNTSSPLFLYLAHAAVHSGNPYDPLRAPDSEIEKFAYIKDYKRQRFAAMLSRLDYSVGEVVKALKNKNMLGNSIIVFTTDNGGPAAGFNLNAASNYPLRGVKNTLWEGGVRGAALIWSPLIEQSTRVANQTMHISDWLPTLVEAAGGTTYDGTWDNWYGPAGREYNYSISLVQNSPAGLALKSLGKAATPQQIQKLRKQANIECSTLNKSPVECRPLKSPCLFNIMQDPCELTNLAADILSVEQSKKKKRVVRKEGKSLKVKTRDKKNLKYPNILSKMENILLGYNKTAVPPGNLPLDLRGDPKYWQYVWTNFGDYLIHSY